MNNGSLKGNNWSAVAVRFDRAMRGLKEAPPQRSEAMAEFLAAGEALRAQLDAAFDQGRRRDQRRGE